MKGHLAFAAILGAAAAAQAQFSTGFESPTYSGSAGGTLLTNGFGGPPGQDGWYVPVTGSGDFNVYTYSGNALGFASNPNGGDQFIGGLGNANFPIDRAQHNMNFSAGGTWTASWDVNGQVIGSTAQVNNVGSFSLQPSGTADYWQQLMSFPATPVPGAYDITYGITTDPAGGTFTTTNSPGAAWTNIPMNHWIHQSTTWDFATNQLLSVSIQDITAGTPATTVDVSGLGWYLAGGANNVRGLALPTDIRCFTGNTNNATGWDNINVAPVPAPGAVALLGLGGLVAGRRRRR